MTKGSSFILRLYFAVVSAVALFTLMFGLIEFLTLGLKTFVFKAADVPSYLQTCGDAEYYTTYYGKPLGGTDRTAPSQIPADVTQQTPEQMLAECQRNRADAIDNYHNQKANDAVRDFALILVSLPLFLTHFRFVYRDWKEDRA